MSCRSSPASKLAKTSAKPVSTELLHTPPLSARVTPTFGQMTKLRHCLGGISCFRIESSFGFRSLHLHTCPFSERPQQAALVRCTGLRLVIDVLFTGHVDHNEIPPDQFTRWRAPCPPPPSSDACTRHRDFCSSVPHVLKTVLRSMSSAPGSAGSSQTSTHSRTPSMDAFTK